MLTRPCSHVRRTPQPAEELVDQRRQSQFTITGFSAHDDNRKKISQIRVSYGRDTHELSLEMATHDTKHTVVGKGKTTSRTFAEKVSAEKSSGSNGVHGPVIIVKSINAPIENSRTSHADTVIRYSGQHEME
jgi:hypothetical protein